MIEETAGRETIQKIKIKQNKSFQILMFFLGLIVFASCDSRRVYEDYYTTATSGWNKDSVAIFQVPVTDTLAHYNLLVNARNLESYPFSNIWLFVDVISPDSVAIRDTLEYQLAYPNGKWTGKGTGGVYENQFVYRTNIFFPHAGNYTFKIQQGMREPVLKGLKDIGIRIETNR